MRQEVQEVQAGEAEQFVVRAKERERSHRVGTAPGERGTTFLRQRLRQDEEAVHRVGQREAAATQNGSRGSTFPRTPPNAGPSTKPRPNAAPTIPKLAARRSAGVMSAMYANAVGMLDDVIPEITRPTKSQPSDGARAMNT